LGRGSGGGGEEKSEREVRKKQRGKFRTANDFDKEAASVGTLGPA